MSVGEPSFVEAHTAAGGSVNRPSNYQHRLGVRSPFINNTYSHNWRETWWKLGGCRCLNLVVYKS